MNHALTPAQLAELDQRKANYDEVIDELVQLAAEEVEANGLMVACAAFAQHLERRLEPGRLASIAAIALVRLSEDRQ